MIEDYLRRQDGIITLAQARKSGLSEHSVRRRVRSGQWRRCYPGVYFADDRPFTAAARIRSVVWGCGARAVASGAAAAWWLELTASVPSVIDVTVPRNSHGRPKPQTRIRRRDLDEADVVERRGVLVTAPALTVLEVHSTAVMDFALRRRLGFAELEETHRRNGTRYGARAAGRLLKAAAGGAQSEAERLALDLLHRGGITGWVANFPIGPYVLDIAFAEHRIAIEIDGWAFHSDHAAFQNDRVRQNWLSLRGWQVLRFTWLDLTTRPERVIAEIRAALSAR